eukprot:5837088-Prymnesium_polylepis.2
MCIRDSTRTPRPSSRRVAASLRLVGAVVPRRTAPDRASRLSPPSRATRLAELFIRTYSNSFALFSQQTQQFLILYD